MREKQKKLARLGDLITDVRGASWKKKLDQYALWNAWDDVAGPAVAQHARPTGWRKQTLVVGVSNHTWLQELQYMRLQILDRIRHSFPKLAISNIRFELGRPKDFVGLEKEPEEPKRELPPLSTSEIEFARDTVRPVADEEARTAIRRLIEKDLALKKSRK